MKNITIKDFSGGIIRDMNPELIPENALEDIVNYEYANSTVLSKRNNWAVYSLLESLTDDNGDSIHPIKTFCVWYPSNLPSDIYDDKVYIIQSNDRIVAYYRDTETTWIKTLICDKSTGTAVYYVSSDRVLIADGVNISRYVSVNGDNDLYVMNLGIEAPNVILSHEDGSDVFVDVEVSDTGMNVEAGNIVEYAFTVEDKYGMESNPSPILIIDTKIQKFPDAEKPLGFSKYLYKMVINGFSVSQYPQETIDKLKYFNIYRRDVEFREGTISKQFVLVYRKLVPSSNASLSYIDTSNNNYQDIDYSKGISPACTSILSVGNAIMTGGLQSNPIKFPYVWDRYVIIGLENNNGIDYVNSVVAFNFDCERLLQNSKDMSVDINDYLSSIVKKNLRIFADDFITPCKVIYYNNFTQNTLACYVKIPHLNREVGTSLYLCIADPDDDTQGVAWNTFDNGKFLANTDATTAELMEMFELPTVRSLNCKISTALLSTSMSLNSVPNFANLNKNGDSAWTIDSTVHPYSKIFGTDTPLNSAGMIFGTNFKFDLVDKLGDNFVAVIDVSAPAKVGLTILFRYGNIAIVLRGEYFSGHVVSYLDLLRVDVGSSHTWLNELAGEYFLDTPHNIQLVIYKKDNRFYWKVRYMNNLGVFVTPANNVTYPVVLDDIVFDGIFTNKTVWTGDNDTDCSFNRFQVYNNIDITQSEFDNMWESFLYGTPLFRERIGCLPHADVDDWELHDAMPNVSFKYKEFDTSSQNNLVSWSDVSGNYFPALNFKRFREPVLAIAEVPSFLKTQYENTILVFTRNTISRMILSDDLSTMAGRTDNVVSEYTSNGLYAKNTLSVSSGNIFWLSEVGMMLWNDKGIGNISLDKIDIGQSGRATDFYGCFVPELNQYFLYDGLNRLCYVYHLNNGAWTTFSGISFIASARLDKGTDYDNTTLFISGNHVYQYPIQDTSDEIDGIITTKKYRLDNVKPLRYRMLWDLHTAPTYVRIMSYNTEFDRELSSLKNTGAAHRFKWIPMPIGFWGEYIQFQIKNISGLTRIELAMKEGV